MKNFNDWLAKKITSAIGTMATAYIFAIIGTLGVIGALTNNTKLVLVVGAISGYFLQLVLLPIIMVGQNLQSQKHEETMKHIKKIHKHLKIKS